LSFILDLLVALAHIYNYIMIDIAVLNIKSVVAGVVINYATLWKDISGGWKLRLHGISRQETRRVFPTTNILGRHVSLVSLD
jgi:hypothetical protein